MILLFVLASGEEEAFAYLYSHYKGLMLQKAYAILHDRMLAEDAVSEAFLRIYRNRHKVDDPASDGPQPVVRDDHRAQHGPDTL